jgi:hypothetical protein
MCEVSFGHEMVGLGDPFNIFAVDANGDAHNHLLRSLSYSSIDSEEIGSFKGFEAKAENFQRLE